RRQVGIAHTEIDHVDTTGAGARLYRVDVLEHVGREAADAVKIFAHGILVGALARSPRALRLAALRRRRGDYCGIVVWNQLNRRLPVAEWRCALPCPVRTCGKG